jgi:ubiquinone/menaquinone biosynthesis C-methylase UbiE
MMEIGRVLKPGGRFIIMDYDTIDHPREASVFDPDNLMHTHTLTDFGDLTVTELYNFGETFGSSLYLFTGIKPFTK